MLKLRRSGMKAVIAELKIHEVMVWYLGVIFVLFMLVSYLWMRDISHDLSGLADTVHELRTRIVELETKGAI